MDQTEELNGADFIPLPEAVAEAIVLDNPRALKFVKGHPRESEALLTPLKGPYAMAFDAAMNGVQDFHVFAEGTPLVQAKATFWNVIASFEREFQRDVSQIQQASVKAAKQLGHKEPVINPNYAEVCKQRAEMQLERARERLMAWDGKGDFTTMMPYALIVKQGTADAPIFDFHQSRLFVQGMMWILRHEE